MRKRLIIILLFILLMMIPSCVPNRSDFQKRKYIRNGHHRHIPYFYQDKYRNPLIKPERKRELTKPSTINLDKW